MGAPRLRRDDEPSRPVASTSPGAARRPGGSPPCRERRPEHDHARAAERRVGVRPGMQAADLVVDGRAPAALQSMRPSSSVEPRRVCGQRVVLRHLVRRARRERVDDGDEQRGAEPGQVALDLVAGLVGADRRAVPARSIGAGVERLHDAHDRHAGLGVAGHHRAMDRRRAAPARQQRRVHVDHAEPRHAAALPAGSCRRRRRRRGRRQRANAAEERRRPAAAPAEARGGRAASASALTGAGLDLLSAAARTVRLRDDADDRWRDASSASSVGTANSGVPKKTTRSGHVYHLPARVSFRILRTIRSRLMPRRRSTNSVPSR